MKSMMNLSSSLFPPRMPVDLTFSCILRMNILQCFAKLQALKELYFDFQLYFEKLEASQEGRMDRHGRGGTGKSQPR